jgi:Cu-Zn family superoxide dismutase
MLKVKYFLGAACFAIATTAFADITVPMNFTAADGVGESAGSVTIAETKYGLMFTPNLQGLDKGMHGRGFHVHVNPDCDKEGMAAGGHFDPKKTDKHLGPYNDKGHLGDLPLMTINEDGTATTPVVAPKLHRLSEVKGHALMVHHAGDNYSDTPEKLGGGGARMVCGVIK